MVKQMDSISKPYDLEKIRNRNPIVFNRIYKEYKDKVFNFLIIKTKGNTEIAEEVLCDTFVSAIESAPKLKNLNNIKGWLIRIAHRRLVDYYRKISSEIKCVDDFDYDNFPNYSIHNEDIQTKHEDLMFENAIDRLRDKYKEIISLRYINNLGVKEISRYMGSNIAVVNSLLARARISLKKEFTKLSKHSKIKVLK